MQQSEKSFNALALTADAILKVLPAGKKEFFSDDLYVSIRFMEAANTALGGWSLPEKNFGINNIQNDIQKLLKKMN